MSAGAVPYLVAAGVVLLAVGIGLVRVSGARLGLARRLGGTREVKVGALLDVGRLPARPIRVAGRVRCANPLSSPDGDRLVAYHRDVEAQLSSGAWRTIDRLRETRSFELWDHEGSLAVDPALAAEPLVTIPQVWEGEPSQLEAEFRPALERLSSAGQAPRRVRASTRALSVTDRLLVLARPVRDPDGRVRLEPPAGGYVISSLAVADAMRLLGGRRRRLAVAGVFVSAAGVAVVASGVSLAMGAWLIGA